MLWCTGAGWESKQALASTNLDLATIATGELPYDPMCIRVYTVVIGASTGTSDEQSRPHLLRIALLMVTHLVMCPIKTNDYTGHI